MVNRDALPNNSPDNNPLSAPSLAERLSGIALFLADLEDVGTLCRILGQELGRLDLGAALIFPRSLDPSASEAGHVIYHLYNPNVPHGQPVQDPSKPFFPDAAADVSALMQRVEQHNVLLHDFGALIESILPQALVRDEDQGLLLPLAPSLVPDCGLLLVWGNALRPQDAVPFSAFASMLGLAVKVIAITTRQQNLHQIEQEVLLDISRILLQGTDLCAMLGEVAGIVRETVGSDLTTIYVYDAGEHCFVPFGAVGWDGGPTIPIVQEPGDIYPNGLAYVYHKRQPVIIDDEETEPRFGTPDFVLQAGVRSVIMAPMIVGDRKVIGAISCSARRKSAFTERDVRLLSLIANSTAQAIERLRLHQDTQRRVDELSILYQVARLASDATDEDELLQRVTDIVQQTLYSDDFGFILINKNADALQPHPSYYMAIPSRLAASIPLETPSVSGQVFKTGIPLRIPDIAQHPDYFQAIPNMQSELCVPLMAGNETLGVINAESHHPNYFSDQDEKLVLTISGPVASALQRLRHYSQEHQQSQQSESLRLATSTLASSLDLQEVLTNILDQLESLIAYDSTCIFLKDERGLLAVAAKGFVNQDEIVGRYFGAEQDLYREIEASGKPLILADTREDPRFHGWADTGGVRCWLGVPMRGRDRVIGYITIDSLRPGAFTSAEADLAQPFANQAAMVIENARLFESERRQLAMAQAQQEIGRLLTSQLDLEEVLETILEVLNRVVPSDSASIMLVNENGQTTLSAARHLVLTPQTESFAAASLGQLNSKFTDGDVALIMDTATDPRWTQLPGSPIRSWVGAVLSIQGKAIGLLNIDSHQPHTFNTSTLPIVRSFASQAAVAIHNARMFDLTQQALNVTEILYNIAHALIQTTDLDDVVRVVAFQSRHAVHADAVMLYLMEIEAGQVYQTVSATNGHIQIVAPALPDARTLFDALWAGPEGESLRQHSPRLIHAQADTEGGHRLIVPLIYRETALGVIIAQNRPGRLEFLPSQLDLLTAIGNQVANALQSIRLFTALDTEKNRLEHRVAERTQDLAQANERLKELDRLKSEFIANVSHELRTPLTNIKLYLSLLERTSVESQKEHLSVIKEQTEHLHQLIETVLDLSQLDANLGGEREKLMPVEVGRLIVSLVEETRPRARAKGIDLEILAVSNRAYVQGDRGQLTQAFEKLLTNALSYTGQGGSIHVQVRREQNQVIISVEDTGMGISPEESPRLFERFFRGQQAVDANISGTGLGLSIVKEIIDRHKGQIEVVSQLGQGSKFTVKLPSISEAP